MSQCKKCGHENTEEAVRCANCDAKLKKKKKVSIGDVAVAMLFIPLPARILGIISMVLGLISVLCAFVPVPFLGAGIGLVAVILSVIARILAHGKRVKSAQKGLLSGIMGIMLGATSTVMYLMLGSSLIDMILNILNGSGGMGGYLG